MLLKGECRMWICDPDFLGLSHVLTLHRQWDPDAEPVNPPEELCNRHMLVRRAFHWDGRGELFLKITADDYYKLYVNGKLLGMGPAQSYPDRQPVDRYALKDLLREGQNVLSFHVFYMGRINRAWQSGDGRQGLWFQLVNGRGRLLLESDRACRTLYTHAWGERGLIGYGTQYMEEVSGGEIPMGWTEDGFDDGPWQAACENKADDHVLTYAGAPPVCFYEQAPVHCERRGQQIFVDMGAEVTGRLCLAADASGGGSLVIRLAEELTTEGRARCPTRAGCDNTLVWHLSGRAEDELDFFDYTAFRYAEIDDPEGRVELPTVRAQVRHYPMDDRLGRFRCDDELANGMFDICRRAVRLGTQEAFLDCPGREKGQYLGDAMVTARAHLLLTGDPRPFRKLLLDFAATARVTPGLLAVAPGSHMQEIADYSCVYPSLAFIYYQMTGDLETLRGLLPVIDGLEDYYDRFRNGDGLAENVRDQWNLVDWPDNLRDGYDFPLTEPVGPGVHNVMNARYYGLKRDADRIRALLGEPMRGESEAVKTAFQRAFRMGNGLMRDAVGSGHTALHSLAIPLYYGLIEREDLPAVLHAIREKGMACGVLTAFFLLRGLAINGAYDLMNELLFNRGEHSWANMLREGATTCWEAWGLSQKWNTSLCHPWAAAPILILIEDVCGVTAMRPGFNSLSHTPHAPEWLGDIELSFGTVQGPVYVRRAGGQWSIRMERKMKQQKG